MTNKETVNRNVGLSFDFIRQIVKRPEMTDKIRNNKNNYIKSIKDKIENIENFSYKTEVYGTGRKTLFYNDDEIELIFSYNRERMSKKETDALKPIIQNLTNSKNPNQQTNTPRKSVSYKILK